MTDDENALAERLVGIAHRLQREGPTENALAAIDDLATINEIADSSAGASRALAEVAAAFLRVIVPSGGRDARAVHAFLQKFPESGFKVLRTTLAPTGVGIGDGLRTEPTVQGLIDVGVLRPVESHPGHYRVAPRSRRLVRDAIEPLNFRLWRNVGEARAEAAKTADTRHPAQTLAGSIGCTIDQARDHLREFPLK